MGKLKRRSDCAINHFVELFGDQWTLLIVRDLIFHGKQTYGEFLQSEEKISTNILAERLAFLEKQAIITKHTDPDHGSKFIYTISKKGRELLPALLEFVVWSAKYDPHTGADKKFVSRIKQDREAVIADILP